MHTKLNWMANDARPKKKRSEQTKRNDQKSTGRKRNGSAHQRQDDPHNKRMVDYIKRNQLRQQMRKRTAAIVIAWPSLYSIFVQLNQIHLRQPLQSCCFRIPIELLWWMRFYGLQQWGRAKPNQTKPSYKKVHPIPNVIWCIFVSFSWSSLPLCLFSSPLPETHFFLSIIWSLVYDRFVRLLYKQ